MKNDGDRNNRHGNPSYHLIVGLWKFNLFLYCNFISKYSKINVFLKGSGFYF